jgi:hypothetical protein
MAVGDEDDRSHIVRENGAGGGPARDLHRQWRASDQSRLKAARHNIKANAACQRLSKQPESRR